VVPVTRRSSARATQPTSRILTGGEISAERDRAFAEHFGMESEAEAEREPRRAVDMATPESIRESIRRQFPKRRPAVG
jgi:hypothetical protein